MEPEVTIHQCTPSQIVNLKTFVLAALLAIGIVILAIVTDTPILYALLLLPLAWAFWKWLDVNSTKFTLTDQRLIVSNGIFTKRTNETELYRVRDTSIEEPFFYRMFGVGNVIIFSTDEAEGKLHFNAYNKPHWIKDQIRNNAEICRQKKRWGNDNVLIHDINN
ncbi:MAG: PH domain-containing protein [Chitinophagaceae bacterium]|nr:MAG: PH domain-containing protein [Chitinophagaceae bacterium]